MSTNSFTILCIIYLCLSSSAKIFFLKVWYYFLISEISWLFRAEIYWLPSKIWVDAPFSKFRFGEIAEVFFSNSSFLSSFGFSFLLYKSYYYRVLLRVVSSNEELRREREVLKSWSTDYERSLLGANLKGKSDGLVMSILLRLSPLNLISFHLNILPDILNIMFDIKHPYW